MLQTLSALDDAIALVVVTAPAGYGKTTTAHQWTADRSANTVWIRCTESDNDVGTFVRRLGLCLGHPRPPDRSPAKALAGDVDGTVVLDDAHLLRRGPVTDLLREFAEALPRGSRLVVLSRARTALDLGRLRAIGRCVELDADRLAFDVTETAAVLAAAGVEPIAGVAETVHRRTRGWPVGVHLAAASLSGSADVARAAAAFGGHDRYVADYFFDEVLRSEPTWSLRRLQRSAVLLKMSGELCDEVLCRTGSFRWLEELEQRQLFVSGPEGHDGWYRFHPLFAEALLTRLRRSEPHMEPVLRRRAAGWLEKRGLPENAVAQAIVGRDVLNAARMVSTYAHDLVNAGRIHAVREWLWALQRETQTQQALAVTGAWVEALCGNAAGAQRYLWAAEHCDGEGEGFGNWAPGAAVIRAALAPFGVAAMRADADLAVGVEPAGGVWHPAATTFLGVANMLVGDDAAAVTALERAAHLGHERHPALAALALAELSLIAAEREDRITAEACAAESRALVTGTGVQDSVFAVLTHVAAGHLAVARGDEYAARWHVDIAARLYEKPSPVAFPWLGAQASIGIGRILLSLGEPAEASRRVADARRYLARLSSVGVLGEQAGQLAADIEHRRGAATGRFGDGLTLAEMRVLRSLRTHLTLGEIATELRISRNTVKTQVSAIYRKLHASTRTEAVRSGQVLGLLD